MKCVLLPEAEADIERLFDFLVGKDPAAAQKAMLAIDEGLSMLEESPMIGVPMKGRPDYRQLFVPFGKSAYVLRYRIDENSDTLIVVRAWHGREKR